MWPIVTVYSNLTVQAGIFTLYVMQKARAMRIGNDGRIYIGGIGRFGYFTPNRLGGLDYTCLSDNLPPNSIVGVIWNILQDKEENLFPIRP